MGRLGEGRLNTTPSVTAHGLSPIVRTARQLGIAGCAGPDGGLQAIGRSRGGAARRDAVRHRRPQAQPGLRAAGRGGRLPPEATWHNVTKPHRPRTNRAAGRGP